MAVVVMGSSLCLLLRLTGKRPPRHRQYPINGAGHDAKSFLQRTMTEHRGRRLPKNGLEEIEC
jgi:hypothetical protein